MRYVIGAIALGAVAVVGGACALGWRLRAPRKELRVPADWRPERDSRTE